MDPILDLASPVRVERVLLRGPGVIVLAGPSGCGKGELANALCALTTIAPERHLSMGEILRTAVRRAREDEAYARRLERDVLISSNESIFDCIDTTDALDDQVRRHLPDLDILFRDRHPDGTSARDFVSQLDWLEFCTRRGLLIPDRWTGALIEARIDELNAESPAPIILDGHPRTPAAARQLLAFLEARDLPVLKVLHLSIGEAVMRARASRRRRLDDDDEALGRRHSFYVEQVRPAIEHMRRILGPGVVERIDAEWPEEAEGDTPVDRLRSIGRVVHAALTSLGVPSVIASDLSAAWIESQAALAGEVGTE